MYGKTERCKKRKTENTIHGFSFVNIIIARKDVWCEKREGINNIFDNYRCRNGNTEKYRIQ